MSQVSKSKSYSQAFFQQHGSIGGAIRAASLTPARRKEIAAKAAAARWLRRRRASK